MPRRKLTSADLKPSLELGKRRVMVDEDTRNIAVRVAKFGEVHSGFGPQVKVPTNANVDAAHVGTADLEDGTEVRIAVLPMHTPHAPTDISAMHAAAWYENSGTSVARGRYSIDDEGIRFDGVLFDDITDAQMDRLTASSASGDWRAAIAVKSFDEFETAPCDFVGSCIVNIGGYSDTYRQAPAQRFALVASGAGDAEGITLLDGGALFASGIGVNGLSTEDVRQAWNEAWNAAHPARGAAGGDSMPGAYSYVEDVYIAPPSIIASIEGGKYVRVPWEVTAGNEIVFGDQVAVERETNWVPVVEENTVSKPAGEIETMTLSASAAKALLDGTATDEQRAEARSALIASGAIDVEAEREARLTRLEQHMIDAVYDAADD